jgi:hypothetical protein
MSAKWGAGGCSDSGSSDDWLVKLATFHADPDRIVLCAESEEGGPLIGVGTARIDNQAGTESEHRIAPGKCPKAGQSSR